MRIALTGGASHELFVEKARGSLGRPLSDVELEAKFRSLAAAELAPDEVDELVESCWSLARLPDAGVLARASVSSQKK